jgi:hypothetical protein
MSCVSLSGTYADFPAKIFIDPSKLESVLSTQFSCYHNVPRNVTSIRGVAHVACLGLVIVPTDGGWFCSRLPFQVKYSPQADMLLGADWQSGVKRSVKCSLDDVGKDKATMSTSSTIHIVVPTGMY